MFTPKNIITNWIFSNFGFKVNPNTIYDSTLNSYFDKIL